MRLISIWIFLIALFISCFAVCQKPILPNAQNGYGPAFLSDTISTSTIPKQTIKDDSSLQLTTPKALPTQTNKEALSKESYYELLDKTLEQKQQFYDSSLNNLNFWAAIVAIFLGVITITLGILAFIGVSKVGDIQKHLEDGLESKINRKVTEKYEPDITDLRERITKINREGNNVVNNNAPSNGDDLTAPESPKNPFG